ncbi:tRNA/tmRNA/rRNA uracil-C5-methylase [Actinoplanes sp. ATCC 53533]|uniref:class I SAM-dependent RNA methyltransferase n=1 Tax=Actinoplanes sp. ATCC 53533 TaxID=1288362 RepID=UPI000F7A4020|nr:TRAM domain-containing protein [Actinoplanes sp. ATCC 53533]RSM70578.1 tRNA/tmRNA/rRNA uracil-C5-methylase [Actinoplanes sp. ATCC 53533]
MSDDELFEGDRIEVTVGAPAHGGHCVARIGGPHGQVVFVRHALPGERVTAEVTELHKGYLRADAVEIHEAAPERVTPPCAFAHPGGCGGCDLQHVSPAAQLEWKADVVRSLLGRMGGLSPERIAELDVRVQPLPGGPLGWRSRVRYAVDAVGRPGLLKHRSHEVVPVDRCLIAHPELQKLDVTARLWPDAAAVEVVASTGGDVSVRARPAVTPLLATADVAAPGTPAPGGAGLAEGPAEVSELAIGRKWQVPPDGFWQVHPAAADTLVAAVLELLQPAEGETSWDLYGGAGLFAAALAERTRARTTVIESAPVGVTAARTNLADLNGVEVVAGRVDVALGRRRVTGPVDLVVLDPPRTGAGTKVVRAITTARPRAVAYVACDPAALARDVQTFTAEGYRLAELRAYDCFPMTQHIECVALFVPGYRPAVV